ncbi:tRNA (adenosine(37)-N6)-dimethylallyltransferase MiaA [Roseiarcaceae bacterium H3SJ34-1]|uniref:tRNA (adenosine(37)-N6)-dimethylallyltransferase MiaA n=1 Tax=Terripilifer ovatus TaxID=3032367 RepID=UPI003AB9933A|nr:tRNA (adenosine(37)-N6)-dimethylallyltransferase MiaA [Roseiarcaceae bacterium H3SJ34-1]
MVSAVLIAGPTASGKSALAISLAQRLGGTVINADSMQVYRDLRIITARPTLEEEAQAPHRLFGHVDAATNYSAGLWLADAAAALADITAAGRTPIFAGGTGLYFKALLHGLSDIPKVPDEVRARVRAEAEGMAPEVLHARLAARDPLTAARLRPSDPQRILRALEVFEATGLPLRHFQDRRGAPLLDAESCACIFLAPDRKELHRRIDARFDAMMAQGALDEVTALAERHLDPALPAMRAHGVPGLIAYLRGKLSLDDAVAKGKIDTRHYSKRQFTWFRHQLSQFKWAPPATAVDELDTLLRKR